MSLFRATLISLAALAGGGCALGGARFGSASYGIHVRNASARPVVAFAEGQKEDHERRAVPPGRRVLVWGGQGVIDFSKAVVVYDGKTGGEIGRLRVTPRDADPGNQPKSEDFTVVFRGGVSKGRGEPPGPSKELQSR